MAMELPAENSEAFAKVTNQIIELVGGEAGDMELTADSTFESQGMDSLKVLALVFKIEKFYDIELAEEDADDLTTVSDLAALVVRRVRESA